MIRRALLAVAIVTILACSSRYERGGKCWSEPDKGGTPQQCPPPGVWWALPDGGFELRPAEEDAGAELDGGSV